jgi:hypothetical protein
MCFSCQELRQSSDIAMWRLAASTTLAAVTHAREAGADSASSDTDGPAPAGWKHVSAAPFDPPLDHSGARATTDDNTNSGAATNGRSLHTRRHWFAASDPSRRSRTRSWTPHGSPPKEAAAGHRVMHKKMQIRALRSRRAKALTQWHWSCGICSQRGPSDPMSE